MVPLPSQEPALIPAPGVVSRGWGIAAERATDIVRIARAASARDRQAARIFTIGGDRTLSLVRSVLAPAFDALSLEDTSLACEWTTYGVDCCETELERLRDAARDFAATTIVGVGGGKALDTAKLIAHQLQLPVVTIPTSAATCAAWTALSNVYSDTGAFQYDVPLDRAPDLLILDYEFVRQAPLHTLKAGIGDALAKWYEASVSSSGSEDVLTIAAVQQARVLRDLLLQKSAEAIACPGGTAWVQVVDASVCLAGVMGGTGGGEMPHHGGTRRPQWLDSFSRSQVSVTRRQSSLRNFGSTAPGRNFAGSSACRDRPPAIAAVLRHHRATDISGKAADGGTGGE